MNKIFYHATQFIYDIHGNVKTLLQDNNDPSVVALVQRYKRMDYTYDLISGNVHKVDYENGNPDQWHHRYEYDADNRIKNVKTSKDNVIYDKDAKYLYYAHGPLARTELGENKVQGCDYAYTIQGWIKGVNSESLLASRDMGQDGNSAGVNKLFARDVFGYSLGYYDNDYKSIGISNFLATKTGSDLLNNQFDLFNGNIGSMVTTITDLTGLALPNGMAYKYDQLNRLIHARGFDNLDVVNNIWGSTGVYNGRYENNFTYEANGNILTQLRKDATGTIIDNLSYRYAKDGNGKMIQNRLYHVNDAQTNTGLFPDDIDDEGAFVNDLNQINKKNNYNYDEIGNLKKDSAEQIQQIKWRVNGKVKEIIRYAGSPKKNLKFDYDATGQRIAKHIYTSANVWEKSTFYLRDAQGNVMAVYEKKIDNTTTLMSYKVKERHIYGSSRVGMDVTEQELIAPPPVNTTSYIRTLGHKQYEKNNHLGSVLAVVSDMKIPVDSNSDLIVDYYTADIVSAQDYYSFGSIMPGRNFNGGNYRFGFSSYEMDDEIKGTGNSYDMDERLYDPRLGRVPTLDQLARQFPSESNYSYAGNNPIAMVDQEGKKKTYYITMIDEKGNKSQLVIINKNEVKTVTTHLNNTGGGPAYYPLTGNPVLQTKTYDLEQNITINTGTNTIVFGEEKQTGERSNIELVRTIEDNVLELGAALSSLDDALNGGGGIHFTSVDGQNGETRKGFNSDAQSENIDLLMAVIGAAQSAATSSKAVTHLEKFAQAVESIDLMKDVDEYIITPGVDKLKSGPTEQKNLKCKHCGKESAPKDTATEMKNQSTHEFEKQK